MMLESSNTGNCVGVSSLLAYTVGTTFDLMHIMLDSIILLSMQTVDGR